MIIQEIRGISPSNVQCWTCRNSPIIHKEVTLGTVTADMETLLQSIGTRHESRHPSHRVTLTLYKQDLAVEQTQNELPIVSEMRRLFQNQQK